MMQGIVENDLWMILAATFIVGLLGMFYLVYRKKYLLTGSAISLQGTLWLATVVILMMSMALTTWFWLAVISPDFIISPFELSQFWGAVLTLGGMIFIVSMVTGFIALHVYRGGA